MSAPDELATFWLAVDAIGAARRQAEEAQQRLRDARAWAHRELRLYGNLVQEDGEVPPRSLLRRLYWEHPEIAVREIAFAFGIGHAGEVHRLAGPGTYETPCLAECGAAVQHTRTSRTADRMMTWPPGRDERYCAACRSERHAEWARRMAENERAAAIAEREEDAVLQLAINEGRATVTTVTEIEYGHIRRYRTERSGSGQ